MVTSISIWLPAISKVLRLGIFTGLGIFNLGMGATASATPPTQNISASDPESLPTPVLTLDQAVATALSHNPEYAAMRAAAQAAESMPSQEGALPEPRLTLLADNIPVDSFSLREEPMTQLQIGLSQELPFFGKRGLMRTAAQASAQAMTYNADETRWLLVKEVKMEWWELFYLEHALETTRHNLDLMRQLVVTAENKYKVSKGMQQDVLLTQVELSGMLDMELEQKTMRSQSMAKLNTLMNRDASVEIQLPSALPERFPPLKKLAEIVALAHKNRPQLNAARAQMTAAQQRLALARKNYYPDFEIGAMYGSRVGRMDMVTLELSMNLPLYTGSRQDAALNQRRHEFAQAQHLIAQNHNTIQQDIAVTLATYERAQNKIALLKRGIIPQYQQVVAAMLAGYRANNADFTDVVNAQKALYDYESQYWRAYANAQQALANLEATTGGGAVYE